jgi:hypothetical protein
MKSSIVDLYFIVLLNVILVFGKVFFPDKQNLVYFRFVLS